MIIHVGHIVHIVSGRFMPHNWPRVITACRRLYTLKIESPLGLISGTAARAECRKVIPDFRASY